MRAIMIMYDSLRRDLLPCYNENTPLDLPNFKRLSEHTVVFDRSYVCSMPCMPARRELHTGRPNFLHRSWGPLEPWDDSMPELLDQAGIHSRLATDHYHYVQDGGATYCGRYSSWACYRGQESDAWQGDASDHGEELSPYLMSSEKMPSELKARKRRGGWKNYANRMAVRDDSQFPQAQTFADGLDFIRRNDSCGQWFLQIETFDPHEPFTAPGKFGQKWFDPDHPFLPDWPPYAPVTEDEKTVEQMREKYYALVEYCDFCLGLVLDEMDRRDMWKDTMLIVNTDHGFFLGEHDWWGKGSMPDFEELTHTPLFIWDPRCGKKGERRNSLVQTIDLAPTVLDFFGLSIPEDMMGKSLKDTVERDEPVREFGIFGYHGGPVNVTDGRYVYMRAPREGEVYEYTLMPTHMDSRFRAGELRTLSLNRPLPFSKGVPVLRIPASGTGRFSRKLKEDQLYDLREDPGQMRPIRGGAIMSRMEEAMARLLEENQVPEEVLKRFGFRQE